MSNIGLRVTRQPRLPAKNPLLWHDFIRFFLGILCFADRKWQKYLRSGPSLTRHVCLYSALPVHVSKLCLKRQWGCRLHSTVTYPVLADDLRGRGGGGGTGLKTGVCGCVADGVKLQMNESMTLWGGFFFLLLLFLCTDSHLRSPFKARRNVSPVTTSTVTRSTSHGTNGRIESLCVCVEGAYSCDSFCVRASHRLKIKTQS